MTTNAKDTPCETLQCEEEEEDEEDVSINLNADETAAFDDLDNDN